MFAGFQVRRTMIWIPRLKALSGTLICAELTGRRGAENSGGGGGAQAGPSSSKDLAELLKATLGGNGEIYAEERPNGESQLDYIDRIANAIVIQNEALRAHRDRHFRDWCIGK